MRFTRWGETLEESELDSADKEAYTMTLRWYMSWCGKRGIRCNVETARDFVAWAENEKKPKAWKSAGFVVGGESSEYYGTTCIGFWLQPVSLSFVMEMDFKKK